MPIDPEVLIGGLPNGLRYYIRPNGKPAKQAELRLVVKAGSVLEDADQLGLAHFVEHMQFEGTRHFPQQGIIDFLSSLGLSIGPGRERGDELRRDQLHAARADRCAGRTRPRAPDPRGLGRRGDVRTKRHRAPASDRALRVADEPRRRRAHPGQDPARPARRIAICRSNAHRDARQHPARAARAAAALLSRLVPARPHGGDRRRRLLRVRVPVCSVRGRSGVLFRGQWSSTGPVTVWSRSSRWASSSAF